MKKLLIIFILLFPIHLYATNYINVFQGNKIIGKISEQSLQELVNASDKYKDIIEAQNNNRIYIETISDIEKIDKENYKTTIRIKWLNENKEEVNFITSIMFLKIENINNDIPTIKLIYYKIAAYGFPLTTLLILLKILIVLI